MPRSVPGHEHPVDPVRVDAARDRLIGPDEDGRLAGILGLIADPVRSRILFALADVDELCVGDLALVLAVSEDSISQQCIFNVPIASGRDLWHKRGRNW